MSASVSDIEKLDEIQYKIIHQISVACESLGAGPDLLSILGSWGDTMPQKDILSMLEDYNAGKPMFDEIIAQVEEE